MAQPDVLYTVIPANSKNGISTTLFITRDKPTAYLEASKLTLSEGQQYVVLTSTDYTEVPQTSDSYLTEIVKPMA